jgi:hypothetical protein
MIRNHLAGCGHPGHCHRNRNAAQTGKFHDLANWIFLRGEPAGMTKYLRMRPLLVVLGVVGLTCVGMEAGCSRFQDPAWYGYYYENVTVNAAPAISRPFSSAKACLGAMRRYTRNASRWSGFACARGCRQQTSNLVTDCSEVVH